MNEALRRSMATKAAVLAEIERHEPISGAELLRRIDSKSAVIAKRIANYDFVGWASTTLWELLDTFRQARYIAVLSEVDPTMPEHWTRAQLTITPHGRRYLGALCSEVSDMLALLEVESEHVARVR